MSDNNNDLGAFLAGFVIGGLVGAATALILAPQSGEEMRHQLESRSRDIRDAGGERIQQYRDLASTYSQDYRDRASHVLSDTRSRVQDAGGRVQEQARIVLDTGKEKVAHVRGHDASDAAGEDETPASSSEEGSTTT